MRDRRCVQTGFDGWKWYTVRRSEKMRVQQREEMGRDKNKWAAMTDVKRAATKNCNMVSKGEGE
jgi:hypothetical protein